MKRLKFHALFSMKKKQKKPREVSNNCVNTISVSHNDQIDEDGKDIHVFDNLCALKPEAVKMEKAHMALTVSQFVRNIFVTKIFCVSQNFF